jgi:quercetin dioxygenase-like cupin family protein
MNSRHRLSIIGAIGVAAIAALGGYTVGASAQGHGEKLTQIFTQRLANVPGKSLTAFTVDYAPGGVGAAHRHSAQAEIFAYVVSGAIRSKVNDGPETVYQAGQFWYEPPGATHSISANASATEPARLLAVFVADDGATLTTFDK